MECKVCSVCNEFSAIHVIDGKHVCTCCKQRVEYEQAKSNLTFDQLYDLLKEEKSFKCRFFITDSVVDIFKKQKYPFEILTKHRFKVWLNLLLKHDEFPSEHIIIKFIHSYINRDFAKPCALLATQADTLFLALKSIISDDNLYRYIHEIAPFIVNVWDSMFSDNVFLCYYKDFGELTDAPLSINDLIERRWHSFKDHHYLSHYKKFINYRRNYGNIFSSVCLICCDTLFLVDATRCPQCLYCFHDQCKKQPNTCPFCMFEFK